MPPVTYATITVPGTTTEASGVPWVEHEGQILLLVPDEGAITYFTARVPVLVTLDASPPRRARLIRDVDQYLLVQWLADDTSASAATAQLQTV